MSVISGLKKVLRVLDRAKAMRMGLFRKSDFRFHFNHIKQAQGLIKSMTAVVGSQVNPAVLKQCDEYAKDVFGSVIYSPWLQAYSILAGTFKEGWIPVNYYAKVVVPKLKGSYGEADNAPLARRLFETNLMPDLAYSVNGLLCTASMEPLKPAELKEYLFQTCDRVVYKKDASKRGKGVSVFNRENFPDILPLGNGTFQSYIVQHPFFNAFDSRSVSTIRITTVVEDDLKVSCRAAFLRLPRSTDTHVTVETAIKVAIQVETGKLHETGYLPNWTPIACHPDSRRGFTGQIIPHFQKCVETCVSLHRKMPFPRAIGWDVIVNDREEIAIMEWNGRLNGISFSEATCGPCFADLGWHRLAQDDRV